MRVIHRIVLHHTGASEDQTVEMIRNYHMGLGWRNIGYHYLVEKTGRLRLGRPEIEIGAHVRGYNKSSVGIAVIGNFSSDKKELTDPQKETLLILLGDLLYRYPRAEVMGHSQLGNTLCPGLPILTWLGEWKGDPYEGEDCDR